MISEKHEILRLKRSVSFPTDSCSVGCDSQCEYHCLLPTTGVDSKNGSSFQLGEHQDCHSSTSPTVEHNQHLQSHHNNLQGNNNQVPSGSRENRGPETGVNHPAASRTTAVKNVSAYGEAVASSPHNSSSRKSSTIRQHYYPEGHWGWMIVAAAVIVHSITLGLQTAVFNVLATFRLSTINSEHESQLKPAQTSRFLSILIVLSIIIVETNNVLMT